MVVERMVSVVENVLAIMRETDVSVCDSRKISSQVEVDAGRILIVGSIDSVSRGNALRALRQILFQHLLHADRMLIAVLTDSVTKENALTTLRMLNSKRAKRISIVAAPIALMEDVEEIQ